MVCKSRDYLQKTDHAYYTMKMSRDCSLKQIRENRGDFPLRHTTHLENFLYPLQRPRRERQNI